MDILFAGNRIVRLVFGNRIVQIFGVVLAIMLVARYTYGAFVFFIVTNRVFVWNYMSIVGLFYLFFDVFLNKFDLSSVLFLFFWMSWIWVPPLIIVINSRRGRLQKSVLRLPNEFLLGRSIVPGIFCALSLVLIFILYSYRYFVYPIPQGWDTVWYLESLRSVEKDFFGSFSSLDSILGFPLRSRPLYFLVLYSVNLLVGCEEVTLMVIPIIFAVLYAFAVYEFAFVGTGSRFVAGLAMLFAPLSYFMVRMSFDLYNNFLGLIIVLLFLTLFLKAMGDASKRNLLLCCVILFVLLLVHVWTWMILVAVLFSFAFIQTLRERAFFPRNFINLVLIILPSVLVGLLVVSVKPTVMPITRLWLFSLPDVWVGMRESPFLLAAAVYGLCVVFFRNTSFTNLVIAWVFVLSLLIFLTGFYPYRFQILYPLGVLAAFGVCDFIGRAYGFLKVRFRLRRRVVFLYVVFPVLLCLLVFSSVLPEAFDWCYLQRPNGLAMMQVYWVYWVYGYNNPNVVVLFHNPPAEPLGYSWDSHIEGFARAYIGFDSLYFGNLTSLLLGYPDSFGRTFDITNRTIILASELYRLTPLELSMSKEINCLGIYIVTSTNISSDCLKLSPVLSVS